MVSLSAFELEPLEELDEQDMFLSILYHDIRGGNAIRMLRSEDSSENVSIRHMNTKNWHSLYWTSLSCDAYVSLNTFKSFRRISDEVYNLSGIFIDLDGHDFKTVQEMDKAIVKTKTRLQRAFSRGEITPPTMITYTGRGLGLFYILDSSIAVTPNTRKSVRFLEQVRVALTAKYKRLLDAPGFLEVDSTVKDYARVCRMPLTLNQKCKRFCRLIHVSTDDENGDVVYCNLKQLAEQNHLFDTVNDIRKHLQSQKVVSLEAYKSPFLAIRLQKLDLLQEIRNYSCAGCREYMVFLYYNTAKQIHGIETAINMTKTFNSRFLEPLPEAELEHAYASVDNSKAPTCDYEGYYKIPDSWIISSLDVTEEENAKCRFGSSKRQIERRAIKESNYNKRENRNKEIAEYILENPDVTYPEIAKCFAVSESMIYRVCKEFGIRRNKSSKKIVQHPANSTDREQKEEVCLHENLQKMSESLLGVPSLSSPASVVETNDSIVGPMEDGLVQAYVDLYGQVTVSKRKARSYKGQYAFRIDSSGNLEYYLIS